MSLFSVTWDGWRGSLDGRPTMWIKTLLAFRGFKLDLHKMVAPDDAGCYHTHPAKAVRLVLWGGYWEEIHTECACSDPRPCEEASGDAGRCWSLSHQRWRPGRVGVVQPELCHRIASLFGRVSYSLWLRWPKSAEVQLRGYGWARQVAGVREDSNG
jgi:hypothetical protein